MSKQICYCFGFTEAEIEADFIKNNGASTIAGRIIYNRENGLCQCDSKHPEHR